MCVVLCVLSLQQRDDKVRVVENLLESSLIQVANKEAELKVNNKKKKIYIYIYIYLYKKNSIVK